jgi:hypothetical protein
VIRTIGLPPITAHFKSVIFKPWPPDLLVATTMAKVASAFAASGYTSCLFMAALGVPEMPLK